MNDMMDIFNPYIKITSSLKTDSDDCSCEKEYTPVSKLPKNPVVTMAYVPFQGSSPDVYKAEEALKRGTLFPCLDKPFLRASRCCTNENN